MRSHHVGRTAAILRENVKLPRPTTCAPSDAAIRLGVAAERRSGRSAFLDFEGMSLFPTAWRILHHTLTTVLASHHSELLSHDATATGASLTYGTRPERTMPESAAKLFTRAFTGYGGGDFTNGRGSGVDSPIHCANPGRRTHTQEVSPHTRAVPHRLDIPQVPVAAALQ